MNSAGVGDVLLFMSVAESGSFSGGGKALGLSRSAAGKAIARLEKRYSVRLFNRTTRAISLTDDGRTLYRHGENIRAAMSEAEHSISKDVGIPRGILRITAPDAFGRRYVLPVVHRYLEAWPEVQIEVSFTDTVSNLVEAGFDLAIRIGVTDPTDGLISRTLMRDKTVLCASPAYLSGSDAPESIEHLSRHHLLFHARHNQRLNWHLQAADGTWHRAIGQSRLRLDSGEALRDAALAGYGIAHLPNFLVARDLEEGKLVALLPDIRVEPVQILALYPHKQFLPPKVRHFIDALAERLRSEGLQ